MTERLRDCLLAADLLEGALCAGDRVTIKGEREVYGDGTVVSVEGNCTNVRWDSDGKVYWTLSDDLTPTLPPSHTGEQR